MPTRWLPLLGLALLTGCCCVVPRQKVTVPQATWTVTDAAGNPLPDCTVAIHHWSSPHSVWHSSATYFTDTAGVVSLSEISEQEMIMPLMIHGVPEYNFTWGVRCDGYHSQVGSFSYVEPGSSMSVYVFMQPGPSAAVDDFATFPASYTQWPLAADGHTGGPVEVYVTPAGDDSADP